MISAEHLVILALVQGITEFLPVSSSAHLALLPAVTGESDQGLLIDVAVHGGTLLAVVLYFRSLLYRMCVSVFRRDSLGSERGDRRLFWMLILATIPVVMAGAVLWHFGWAEMLRSPASIAWMTIVFGLLLFAGDHWGAYHRTIKGITAMDAIVVGCSQVFALIPGVSRAGVTITAARFLGIRGQDAATFSFLLAIPAVGAAFALGGYEIVRSGDVALTISAAIAFLLSLTVALVTIRAMLWFTSRYRLTIFVVYRIFLGAAILAALSFGNA